jgi:hypothetical protein
MRRSLARLLFARPASILAAGGAGGFVAGKPNWARIPVITLWAWSIALGPGLAAGSVAALFLAALRRPRAIVPRRFVRTMLAGAMAAIRLTSISWRPIRPAVSLGI